MESYYADECRRPRCDISGLKQGEMFYTYTPAVQNMATVPKPPSTLARMATVNSLNIPFGRLDIMSQKGVKFQRLMRTDVEK